MSYLVLARKYRPQTFEEVYAQDQITQILKNSIQMKRIAHAYLFSGPRGVGKTSLARIFAKSLNCLESEIKDRPCNKCENCCEITEGISQDVIEIDGASNTGVEDIRDLQKELLYATSNSRYKIYIIDEVHMLSKNAFNALLKTLEEPPENVIFIFATTEPHKVLPTIISRCQRFDFKRIPIKKIVARLQDITKAEKINITDDSLFYLAKLADGSMRDSQSLLDQVLAYGREKITLEDIQEIFGTVAIEIYEGIMRAINERDTSRIINELHQILEKGTDLQEFMAGMLEYIRNLTLIKIGVTPQEAAPNELIQMQEAAALFQEKQLIYLMTILVRTKTEIKSSNNPVLLVEMAFIKLSYIEEMESLDDILDKIKNIPAAPPTQFSKGSPASVKIDKKQQDQEQILHQQVVNEHANLKKQGEKAKELFQELDLEKISKYLPQFSESISREKIIVGKELENAELSEFKGNVLKLIVRKNIGYSHLNKHKEWLENKMKDYFGQTIRLQLILDAPQKKKSMPNPTLSQIESKNPELGKKLRKIDPNMQITTIIKNDY